MAQKVNLTAADGHAFEAWRTDPFGQARGVVVVLHAIYGLTPHIGEVCDRWAGEGYTAIAPALYDRVGRGCVFGYDADGAGAGIAHYARLAKDEILADVAASSAAAGQSMPKIISGFCTGGTWAWISSAELRFDAQVNFYGSHVVQHLAFKPQCPTVMHFGDSDHIVDGPGIEKIRAAHPDVLVHVYRGGGHAFFNPEQLSYNRESADKAWSNSMAFLNRHLA